MCFPYGDEKGMALPIALAYLALLTLAGTTAVISITTDTKITANYKANVKAFYVAEAGVQEARQRLNPTSVDDPIEDPYFDSDDWQSIFWGARIRPTAEGDSYSPTTSWWWAYNNVPSLQTGMDYTVVIRHKGYETGSVWYWGDKDGELKRHTDENRNHPNIYLIKSEGTADGAFTRVEVEAVKVPFIKDIKGALYYEGISANIGGDATKIDGGPDKWGIVTPWEDYEIDPLIIGAGAEVTGRLDDEEDDVDPNFRDHQLDLNVQLMADFFETCADFSYDVNSTTHTASTTPGPGDGWGTPILSVPECTDDACNIVYYDTNGTSITLSGGVSGCGILVIDGNLTVNGDFSWYGTIVVTGDLTFSGDGEQEIQGAVISGGSVAVTTTTIGLKIFYNSDATTYHTENHALCILSWKEGSVE